MRSIRIALAVVSLAALAASGSASAASSPAGAAQETDIVQTAVERRQVQDAHQAAEAGSPCPHAQAARPVHGVRAHRRCVRQGAGAKAERAASKQVEVEVRAPVPRGGRRVACRRCRPALLRENAERQEGPHPCEGLERLPEQGAGRHPGRDGLERGHPRNRPRPHPALVRGPQRAPAAAQPPRRERPSPEAPTSLA